MLWNFIWTRSRKKNPGPKIMILTKKQYKRICDCSLRLSLRNWSNRRFFSYFGGFNVSLFRCFLLRESVFKLFFDFHLFVQKLRTCDRLNYNKVIYKSEKTRNSKSLYIDHLLSKASQFFFFQFLL